MEKKLKIRLLTFISLIVFCFGNVKLQAQITASGTLPIIHISTEEEQEITSREEYINATVYIEFPEGSTEDPVGTVDNPLQTLIRGRGNSTWVNFDKKPYRLKLDKKAAPFGWPKNKHFVLVSHAPQQSYPREAAAFEIARILDFGWVPRDQPVEVVLNGDYKGVYAFYEKLRIDSGRLDINEQPDLNDDPETIDDGWLVEIDNTYDEPQLIIDQPVTDPDDRGTFARFTLHTPEVLSEAQTEWITNELQQITAAIYDPDKSVPAWSNYLDIESLAKYYIVQELTCNFDAFVGSTYIHHTKGGKWKFGPIWDSGWTFVPDNRIGSFIDERINTVGNDASFIWIRELMKYPYFWENVLAEWEKFYPSRLSDVHAFIDSFYEHTHLAYEVESLRWPEYISINCSWNYSIMSHLIDEYAAWMDNYIRLKVAGVTVVGCESIDYEVTRDGAIIVTGSPEMEVSLFSLSGQTIGHFTVDSTGRGTYQLPAKGIYIMRMSAKDEANKSVKLTY